MRKGFTLVELMIVIAIISILALVLLPNFVIARHQARLSACQSNIKNISTAVETYCSSNNDQYPQNDFIVDNNSPLYNYIQKDIKCPLIKEYYEYKINTTGNKYWIYCPTISNTKKHKTNKGIITKIYLDNVEGLKIEY